MKAPFIERFVSRKFVAATLTALLMAMCWVLSEWLTVAKDNFGTLVTGLVSALSAYTAGNVMQDHVMAKTDKAVDKIEKFVLPKPEPSKPE